jgi:hypothetical protein
LGAEVSKPGLVVRVHVGSRRMTQSYCRGKIASKRKEPCRSAGLFGAPKVI